MTLHHLDVFHDLTAVNGRELIVDNFAGGGGASEGIRRALGRCPDVAINHDAEALAMHEMNHPETRHISKNIWQVDPLDAIEGKPVGLGWFSPDCKHFSKAKGGKPVKREIRDLAWVVVNWAKRAKPSVSPDMAEALVRANLRRSRSRRKDRSMSWRNHYRSERGKLSTRSLWPTKAEAEARAAHMLDTLKEERTAWARSVAFLGAIEEGARS